MWRDVLLAIVVIFGGLTLGGVGLLGFNYFIDWVVGKKPSKPKKPKFTIIGRPGTVFELKDEGGFVIDEVVLTQFSIDNRGAMSMEFVRRELYEAQNRVAPRRPGPEDYE